MNLEYEAFLELEAALAGDSDGTLVGSLRDRLTLWMVSLKRELDQGLPATEYLAKQHLYRALEAAARNLGPLGARIRTSSASSESTGPNTELKPTPLILP